MPSSCADSFNTGIAWIFSNDTSKGFSRELNLRSILFRNSWENDPKQEPLKCTETNSVKIET